MKEFNIDDIQYAIDNNIISIADVLENTEKMKREQILEQYGDLIKHYGNEWYFRIPDKTLKNGCFRRRSKNREDIENKLCDYFIELEKRQQADKEQNTMTLKELFYEFMEYKKSKVSGGTINRMMQDWKKFYEPHTEFIHKPFVEITKIDVDNLLNDIVNERTMKDKAFKNMCGVLKQTFEYAVNAEYIDKSPYRVEVNKKKITPTRKKANEKEVFTSKERDILIKEMERRIQNDPLNTVPLAIMLDFEIGVRCGELLALKESDIISENGTSKLYIHRQVVKENNITDLENIKQIGWNVVDYTKSDCGERKIPLTPKALEYIDRIRQINVLNGNQNKGFLFLTEDGTIITRDALDGQLRRGCAYAGIPIRSMHKIRKTYASTLYQRGISITIISKLLGHADESTTMKHYIFNLKDETETDSLVLNALSSNVITNNLTTISREEISESVTDGDNKIISFAAIKKWKTPHKQRVSH